MDLKQAGKIAKALSDPYRLQIMQAVQMENDWLQCTAVIGLFDLAQSTVSHHLKQLADAGLLLAAKDGRNAKYQVNKAVITAYIDFMGQLII
jgi:ArsR family transcriptional regulator